MNCMDTAILIHGYRCVLTCPACPEQYDVFDAKTGQQVGYLRLRSGVFRADSPSHGGATVYCTETVGDGMFEDNDERLREMSSAIAAIKEYRNG